MKTSKKMIYMMKKINYYKNKNLSTLIQQGIFGQLDDIFMYFFDDLHIDELTDGKYIFFVIDGHGDLESSAIRIDCRWY